MAPFACSCHSKISLRVDRSWPYIQSRPTVGIQQRSVLALRGMNSELFGQRVSRTGALFSSNWSFVGGSKAVFCTEFERFVPCGKGSGVSASWFSSSQIASSAFTLGTTAVLPFYTFMVLAPKAKLTKMLMESNTPYAVLGLVYAYLLYLSWTPDTIRLIFANEYWLPELPGIQEMFSSEITLASAWIHLLAVDLFAARQVFHDGLENDIETRHSVSLCLLFCPMGILTHVITKLLIKRAGNTERNL